VQRATHAQPRTHIAFDLGAAASLHHDLKPNPRKSRDPLVCGRFSTTSAAQVAHTTVWKFEK